MCSTGARSRSPGLAARDSAAADAARLVVDGITAAHNEVISLGAKLLKAAGNNTDAEDDFQVYADPAGHPFCLCWIKDGSPS
jgi:hypothetical protein